MKIILGSKSPRRKELLAQLGLSFEIRTKDTDESYPESLLLEDIAEYVAEKKANELVQDLNDDELLICADTVVIVDGEILGKPHTEENAILMLGKLNGKSHKVITGVVLSSLEKRVKFSVVTEVFFKPLSGEAIENYVREFKPFDKAGSYGIQEWIGAAGIQKIVGSYNNVVGLPTCEVYEALELFK